MRLNPNSDDSNMKSKNGNIIKQVENFIYFGSFIGSTEKYIEIRIAKAWSIIISLYTIWKSKMSDNLKRSFFRVTVESVLVYGAMDFNIREKVDGAYTRMLRTALNKIWKQHLMNKEVYGNIQQNTNSKREPRLRSRLPKTYIDELMEDTRCTVYTR